MAKRKRTLPKPVRRVLAAAAICPPKPPPKPLYSDVVLATPGLVSYWKLDETSGTTAVDSKDGNDGTYSGVVLDQPWSMIADRGRAAKFDDATDHVSLPTNPNLEFSGTYSMEIWHASTPASGQMIFGRSVDAGSGFTVWHEGIRQGGSESIWFRPTNVGANMISGPGSAVTGAPVHIVGTFDETTVCLYINGQLERTEEAPTPLTHPFDLTIGAGVGSGTSGTTASRGYSSDAALYNTILDQATVQEHYQAGAGLSEMDPIRPDGLAVS